MGLADLFADAWQAAPRGKPKEDVDIAGRSNEIIEALGAKAAQTWPARMATDVVDAFGTVMDGGYVPGLRRLDVTDKLPPQGPTADSTWLGNKLGIAPVAWEPNDKYIQAASDIGGLVMGGGLPAAEKGAVGIFGGRLAKTADHSALSRAEGMAANGAPREQIWNDTGWFQGVDGKWRFEIPDDTSSIGRKAMDDLTKGETYGATSRTAGGALWHKDLYDAYPELRNIDVDARWNADLKNPSGGFSSPEGRGGRPLINIETNTLTGEWGPRSVMLHEMQHPIQGIEKFGSGGSPGVGERAPFVYEGSLVDPIRARRKELEGIMEQAKYGTPEYKAAEREYYSLAEREDRAAGIEGYKRLAGEVEARNVQTRMDMTPEQRRATAPWLTEDVPADKQIVTLGSGQTRQTGLAALPTLVEDGAAPEIDDKQQSEEAITADMARQIAAMRTRGGFRALPLSR